MINRPILPPKEGYVEVIDQNGNHIYKPTQETLKQQSRESLLDALEILLSIEGGNEDDATNKARNS